MGGISFSEYLTRQQLHREAEIKATLNACSLVENSPELSHIVCDTSGSICELVMDPNEEQIPKAINKRTAEGKTVPTKYEDMYPFLNKSELESNNYRD